MPNIYVRTGPFDDAPQPQGSSGDASDPWAAFPDAPPQSPAYASDPWAAFPDAPSRFSAPAISGDPWAAYPDWPPAQAEFGDFNPFAGSPDTPWSLPTSPLPSNAPWSVNEIPPMGALYSAPKSFGSVAPLQTNSDPWAAFPDAPPQTPTYASDPWAAFPDWPPAQAQFGDADLLAAYPDLHARFFALQAPGNGSSGEGLLPSDTGSVTGSIGNFLPFQEQQKLGDAIGADRNLYQAMYQSQPSVDPTLIQIAERNWACTNAAYTCLDNSTSPKMRQGCLEAEKECNELVEQIRRDPLLPGVYGLHVFPDGTGVGMGGGPEGRIFLLPSHRPGAVRPGPLR